MKKLYYICVVIGLLVLAHGAGGQAQNAPATPAVTPEGAVRVRPADPYRAVKAGDIVAAIQPEGDDVLLMISLQWEVFSLPLTDAHKFLSSFKTDGERYAEIVKRADTGGAVLEELQMLRTRSGQRAKVEAIDEMIYPTEFVPPSQPAEVPRQMVPNPAYTPLGQKPTANAAAPFVAQPTSGSSRGNALPYPCPTAFETRNVGSTLEVEPTLFADGVTIDVTIAPELVRFIGNEPHTPDRSLMQPKFQTQKISTSFTIKSGRTFLLGTQSPSHLSGVEGANQEKVIWLSFVTAETVAVK